MRPNDLESPPPGTLGYLLFSKRQQLGWSQAQCGRDIGNFNQGTYSKWESNNQTPRPEHVPLIAAWLGVPEQEIRDLVFGTFKASETYTEILEGYKRMERRVGTLESLIGKLSAELSALRKLIRGGVTDLSSDESAEETRAERN